MNPMTRTPAELADFAIGSHGDDPLHPIDSATESLGAGSEARKHLELLCRTLHAMPGHFAILNARGAGACIVFVNVALARDYGFEAADLIGHPFFALFASAEDGPEKIDRIRQELNSGRDARAEFQAVRRDGSTFTAGMVFAPIKDEHGLITHFGCSARDITAIIEEQRDKRALQEQLYTEMRERERIAIELRLAQKLESVGRLAAGIAHEINTPIQYVGDSAHFLKSAVADLQQLTEVYRGAVEALFRGESPEIVRANLTQIDALVDKQFIDVEIPQAFARTLEGVERVTSIVRAMKEFAHPDAHEQSPADINHAIETTLLVARNEYKYHASVHSEQMHVMRLLPVAHQYLTKPCLPERLEQVIQRCIQLHDLLHEEHLRAAVGGNPAVACDPERVCPPQHGSVPRRRNRCRRRRSRRQRQWGCRQGATDSEFGIFPVTAADHPDRSRHCASWLHRHSQPRTLSRDFLTLAIALFARWPRTGRVASAHPGDRRRSVRARRAFAVGGRRAACRTVA
jgi:PAS domain S-box-containing protein